MCKDKKPDCIALDVQAVITSFNQGPMIKEAVQALERQTTPPSHIFLVDDGSTDTASRAVLKALEEDTDRGVPVTVIRRPNGGVSSARNTGIARTKTPLVLVLDGDDRLAPEYIERVAGLLRGNEKLVAASSWMQTFGVLEAVVRPAGGSLAAFLSRNACPATHIVRRSVWERCGGYDETMRSGFEDWEFFLHMLEVQPDAQIGIVAQPLLEYRTAPASANVQSMTRRLELMKNIIEKHKEAYSNFMTETLLAMEAVSMERLYGWEQEITGNLKKGSSIGSMSEEFLRHPTYGDGGMAAAVRIASAKGYRR